jgi:hypothetical protein
MDNGNPRDHAPQGTVDWDFLRACRALAAGGELANFTDPETQELAADMLRRGNFAPAHCYDGMENALREGILADYWRCVSELLFGRAPPDGEPFVSFYFRKRAGEAFRQSAIDPLRAWCWPVAGSA